MIHMPFKAPSLETMDQLLPAFEFIALIAADETGAVYLSNQRSLGRDVAIKILAPHLSEDSASQSQFESTCRSMAQLNHPNLVGIYNSGSVEQMLYFVMEFVPGKSLAHSTKGQSVDLKQALLIIEGICAGLVHAHQHQIIHGELNLRNVLLNKKAEPKVTNFGLSQRQNKTTGISIINSRFIAPEVLHKANPSSPQSDIFSLGAILYELLTGKPHRSDAPPPSTLSACSPEIDTIWRQATRTNLNERTPEAITMLAALTAASAPPKTKAKTGVSVIARKSTIAIQPPSPKNRKVSTTPIRRAPSPSQNISHPTSQGGFNWKLVRNLCIVAGLAYVAKYTWDLRRDTMEGQMNASPQAPAIAEKTKPEKKPPSEPEKKPQPPPDIRPATPIKIPFNLKPAPQGQTNLPPGL